MYAHVCIYIYIYIYVSVCLQVSICARVHTNNVMYIHTDVQTQVYEIFTIFSTLSFIILHNIVLYVYIHIYIHIYVYT